MSAKVGHAIFLSLLAGSAAAQTTERVSVGTGGVEANAGSSGTWLSADGRLALFSSTASNLVPGDTNNRSDVFVHDRQSGTTERVSVDSGGGELGSDSYRGALSASGRFAVFESWSQPVPGNNVWVVSVRDRQAGTTVSIA